MNRRNKNKSASATTAKPSPPSKQTPPPAKPTPPEPTPPPAKAGAAKSVQSQPTPALTTSGRLRQEWKSFEIWLSARRADRDKRLCEKLKELTSVKGKNKLQQQPMDMTTFEMTLNEELAEQARVEWLKRLDAAGLDEQDWFDITPDEMKAVEAAFAPPMPGDTISEQPTLSPENAAQVPVQDFMNADWSSSLPGGWNTGPTNLPNKAPTKRPQDAIPIRSSPLSNGWGTFDEKPPAPPPESLWNMHAPKSNPPKPPTPPASSLPTPENLWEMHMSKKAPPPPTPPPTEPVSPDSLWDPAASKKQPSRQMREPNHLAPPKTREAKVSKASPASDNLWGVSEQPAEPEPLPARPTLTGNSIESAHNHGYMSPLLIELECDEFPIAPQDILTNELVEDSIRQWHQQAAEADIQLRRQLLSVHWAKRDWEELLGSHVQEMERNARAVIGHLKDVSEEERLKRMREDKQRRLAGIRNVTSNNKRWSPSTSVEPSPPRAASPARPPTKVKSPDPPIKTQPTRKSAARKHIVTVEDAPSSEWEERSSTPSLASSKSKAASKDSTEFDSLWAKEETAKAAPDLMSNLWNKSGTPVPDPEPTNARRKAVNSNHKSPLSPAEATRNPSTPLPWDGPRGAKSEKSPWENGARAAVEEEKADNGSSWGAASAWNFAMNAISGDKFSAPAKANARPSADPPENGPKSFWSSESSFPRSMSQGPATNGFSDPNADGRFTPWKPPKTPEDDVDIDDPTKKMADLAFQHLYQTANPEDEYDPSDLHNAMSMYTKAVNSTTRKKPVPAGKR